MKRAIVLQLILLAVGLVYMISGNSDASLTCLVGAVVIGALRRAS